MAPNMILVSALLVLGFALNCRAVTYMVGDNSGWDISTDMNTWSKDKTFNVGDVLVFQYSSSESVNEVTKQSFDKCNTTNILKSYSAGNTTVTLTKPGERYFVSGNKLYCLGGMKLHVHVENNQAYAPTAPPQPAVAGSDLPQPSSKSNLPPSNAIHIHGGIHSTALAFIGLFMAFFVMFFSL